MKNTDDTKPDLDFWPRADREALSSFDPSTKHCTMNCGPSVKDPRTAEERRFICDDCITVSPEDQE